MAADVDPSAADIRGLVARCLAHEDDAVAELIGRFQPQVFGLCLRMLGQRQDAEDVTQESFVRAIRSLARWDNNRDFVPWLLAIAGNRCRTLLSSRGRRPRTVAEIDVADGQPDAQRERQLAEEVGLALGTLRGEYRQAFVLFHDHQLSYAEIADSMQCPVGTVKTWVHRARRELVARLIERGVTEEYGGAVRRI